DDDGLARLPHLGESPVDLLRGGGASPAAVDPEYHGNVLGILPDLGQVVEELAHAAHRLREARVRRVRDRPDEVEDGHLGPDALRCRALLRPLEAECQRDGENGQDQDEACHNAPSHPGNPPLSQRLSPSPPGPPARATTVLPRLAPAPAPPAPAAL